MLLPREIYIKSISTLSKMFIFQTGWSLRWHFINIWTSGRHSSLDTALSKMDGGMGIRHSWWWEPWEHLILSLKEIKFNDDEFVFTGYTHDIMEALLAFMALCEGYALVKGGVPSQRVSIYGALGFPLSSAWPSYWANSTVAANLRCHNAHTMSL